MGKTLQSKIEFNKTISDLKIEINNKYGIPVEYMTINSGTVLEDSIVIDSSIQKLGTIYLIINIDDLEKLSSDIQKIELDLNKIDKDSEDYKNKKEGLEIMKFHYEQKNERGERIVELEPVDDPCEKEIDSFKINHRLDDIRIISKENILESIKDISLTQTIKEQVIDAIWKFAVDSGEKIDI